MSARDLQGRIRRRAQAAGVALDTGALDLLERYYRLLARWNAKINLTAFQLTPGGDDPSVDRLLIEPAVAARFVPQSAHLAMDIGSGGGSPAIPLKILLPRLVLRMVEAKTRKAVFLREAVRELNLTDAFVETARYEALLARPDLHETQDLVTLRAVRVETRALLGIQAFLRPPGQMFLLRGPGRFDLGDAVPPPLAWTATHPLVDELRSKLIVLTKLAVGRHPSPP